MKTLCVLSVTAGLILTQPVAAQVLTETCDRQARSASGYQGGRLPKFKIGPFTAQISGSVTIGAGRSSGPSGPKVPRGAGAGARDLREIRQEKEYRRLYEECLSGN